jgi:hypothetical protein
LRRAVRLLICFATDHDELCVQAAAQCAMHVGAAMVVGIDDEVRKCALSACSTLGRDSTRQYCAQYRGEPCPEISRAAQPLVCHCMDLSNATVYPPLNLSGTEARRRFISL